MLLTDIFTGLSVLALFLLVVHGTRFPPSKNVRCSRSPPSRRQPTARRWRYCSGCAAPAGSRALSARTDCGGRTAAGQPDHRRRRRDAAGRQLRAVGAIGWTPGGYGVAFGRMLQDGIVARYLNDHCPQQKLKLCPYRNRTAGHRGQVPVGRQHVQHARPLSGPERRDGLHRRCIRSPNIRCGRPGPRFVATAQQLVQVGTGEGTTAGFAIPTASSSAICRRRSSRCARRVSSTGTSISPPSTGFMFRSRWRRCWLVVAILRLAIWRRRLEDVTLLAATVTFALLGNAFVCERHIGTA